MNISAGQHLFNKEQLERINRMSKALFNQGAREGYSEPSDYADEKMAEMAPVKIALELEALNKHMETIAKELAHVTNHLYR